MKGRNRKLRLLSMVMVLLMCVSSLPALVYAVTVEDPVKFVETIQEPTGGDVTNPATGQPVSGDGDGIYVKPGYLITYRIQFGGTDDQNGFETEAILTDILDGQVTFVSAYDDFHNSISAAAPQSTNGWANLKYDSSIHTVTWETKNLYLNWDVYNVYITVSVDDDAEDKVVNKAHIWYGEYGDDKGFDTNEVQNPLMYTNPHKHVTDILTNANRAITAGDGVTVDRSYKITYRVTFDLLADFNDRPEWSVLFNDVLDQGATFVEAEDCFGNRIDAASPSLSSVTGLEFAYDSASRAVDWKWNYFRYQSTTAYNGEEYYIDITVQVNSDAKTKVVNQAEVQYYEEAAKKTNIVENPLRTSGGGGGGNTTGYYVVYHSEATATTVRDGRHTPGDTVTVRAGTIFTTPSGKTFAGWAETDGGAVVYQPGETFIMPSATVDLYAVYRGGSSTLLNREDHYAYVVGYQDGTVRPEDNISREEVTTIFFRLLTDDARDIYYKKTNAFSDVQSGRWSNIAISTMQNGGIVSGYNDGTFRPEATITRAEVAVIAAQFDESAYAGSDLFSDISGHWARDYINRAADLGWVSGYSNGTFRPDEPITRAEMMTLINQVLERNPQTVGDLLDTMTKWPDNNNTSEWYYIQVQEATNSHYYKRNAGGTETWTQLRATRNWAELERD